MAKTLSFRLNGTWCARICVYMHKCVWAWPRCRALSGYTHTGRLRAITKTFQRNPQQVEINAFAQTDKKHLQHKRTGAGIGGIARTADRSPLIRADCFYIHEVCVSASKKKKKKRRRENDTCNILFQLQVHRLPMNIVGRNRNWLCVIGSSRHSLWFCSFWKSTALLPHQLKTIF